MYTVCLEPGRWCSGKESTCQCRRREGSVSIPGLGRFPGEVNGNPLQYSCLGNPMDRGTWWAIVRLYDHGVTKSRTWLSSAQNMPRTKFGFNPVHKEKEKNIGRKCIKILKWLCWEDLSKFSLPHINFIVKIWLPNNPVHSLTQPIDLMVLNISKAAGSLERVAIINKCNVWLWVYFWSAFSKITCLHIATFWGEGGQGRNQCS